MRNEQKRSPFEVTRQYPEKLTPEEYERYFAVSMEAFQKIKGDSAGRDVVEITMNHSRPIQVLNLSDLHIGSAHTDMEMLKEIKRRVLETKDLYVFFGGDEVDGKNPDYEDQAAGAPFDFSEQLMMFEIFLLRPLCEANKVLGMVVGYPGHLEWVEKASVNPWIQMAQRCNLPLVGNGKKIVIKFSNGYEHTLNIWHNPPKGSTEADEVGGLRKRAKKVDERMMSDSYHSGHLHMASVSQEVYANASGVVTYVQSGTAKGTTEGIPHDPYGEKLSMQPFTDPLGQGEIIDPGRNGRRVKNWEEKTFPYISVRHGEVAFRAFKALDRAESQGITEELAGEMKDGIERGPKIFLHERSSEVNEGSFTEEVPIAEMKVGKEKIKNPYSDMELVPPYDKVSYNIQSRFPIILHFLTKTRLGSSSSGIEKINGYIDRNIIDDPYALAIFLNNMIDKDSGKSPRRLAILNAYTGIINGIKGHALGVMMDSGMRNDNWRKGVRGASDSNMWPVAPGSYIANETGVPLTHHLSTIELSIGPSRGFSNKPSYTVLMADKLMNSGSLSKSTWGLRAMYDRHSSRKPGIVVGGHMPDAGYAQFYDGGNVETHYPIMLASGWFAKDIDTAGKGNVSHGAKPGQAVIVLPGNSQEDYLAFPAATEERAATLHKALYLLTGLDILNIYEKVVEKKRR